jgi:hypothetical protein
MNINSNKYLLYIFFGGAEGQTPYNKNLDTNKLLLTEYKQNTALFSTYARQCAKQNDSRYYCVVILSNCVIIKTPNLIRGHGTNV